MRKRFRGNYPVALSAELEGGGLEGKNTASKGQLYAGKPMAIVPGGETDGREEEKSKRKDDGD
ncbi:MAG: oligosaccharyl transferase glycoprotein complex, beta subunit [Watsoniomyces obsoletus]|nr:MAG: oligosaccharyl transferase glycoprotein complex, beta subunit [Watsoniomyces obsoletus]